MGHEVLLPGPLLCISTAAVTIGTRGRKRGVLVPRQEELSSLLQRGPGMQVQLASNFRHDNCSHHSDIKDQVVISMQNNKGICLYLSNGSQRPKPRFPDETEEMTADTKENLFWLSHLISLIGSSCPASAPLKRNDHE